MPCIGINYASLLGILDILLSLAIFALTWKLIAQKNRAQDSTIVFDIIQIILLPLSLLICGTILLLQGWRIDLVLLLAMLLLHLIIIFMVSKDFLLYSSRGASEKE